MSNVYTSLPKPEHIHNLVDSSPQFLNCDGGLTQRTDHISQTSLFGMYPSKYHHFLIIFDI